MKKNILVPNDFSESALSLARHAIDKANGDAVEIVMMHCMFLPTSIIDLLYFSKSETLKSLATPNFKRAYLELVRRHAANDLCIRMDLFTGLNQRAFNNFIQGNDIHEALIPDPYRHDLRHKDSFDPLPYVRRSGIKITEVTMPTPACTFTYLAELGY